MENKPIDRSLFIPILIGGLALAGIVLVLVVLRLSAARPTVPATASPTPLRFQFLATEPGIVYPTAADTPTEAPAGEVTAVFSPTALVLPTRPQNVILPTSTLPPRPVNTATPTARGLGAIYDDADFTLIYNGTWIGQSGVSGTYRLTLHISSTIGNAVTFSFYGQKIRLSYQAGPSLGQVAIRLDNQDFQLAQAALETETGEWESPVLTLANHTITITHISGGSINIDALEVIDISTPTPSITPTP